MSIELFEHYIEAVEENNHTNSGSWSDWDDYHHVATTYKPFKDYVKYQDSYPEVTKAFIEGLIRDNGENLDTYIKAYECLVWGFPFDR